VRNNIIPDEVELLGTMRSLDPDQRPRLHELVKRTAELTARASGARAEVDIELGYPITYNDPDLLAEMRPTLARIAGADHVVEGVPRTGAEDFSFYQQQAPGLYLWLGIRPEVVPEEDAAPNHSPEFFVDEAALPLGVRLLAGLAADYLTMADGAEEASAAPDAAEPTDGEPATAEATDDGGSD
jgi:amidohydrolase